MRDLTRKDSNVPRHVLKAMLIGMLKRYVIIAETEKANSGERRALYDVLVRQGWNSNEVKRVYPQPKYEDRAEFTGGFMKAFIERHIDSDHITLMMLRRGAHCDDGGDERGRQTQRFRK